MNTTRRFVGGIIVLAAAALSISTQSAPAQIAYLPDGEEWQPVTELQEWENSSGHLVCTGDCPGKPAACCSTMLPY